MSRLPNILFWIAFALVLILLGPIGYAIVSLDSRPGGSGADWPAKLLVALLVLGAAVLVGLLVKLVASLALHLLRRRRGPPG
jgi:hypothetical protein